MDTVVRISTSTLLREFGRLRSLAHREPVVVTNHGRDDIVLVSAEEFQRLRNAEKQASRNLDWISDREEQE